MPEVLHRIPVINHRESAPPPSPSPPFTGLGQSTYFHVHYTPCNETTTGHNRVQGGTCLGKIHIGANLEGKLVWLLTQLRIILLLTRQNTTLENFTKILKP